MRYPPDTASNIGLGAVLTQESEQGEIVVAYDSRLLHGAERHILQQRKNAWQVCGLWRNGVNTWKAVVLMY